MMGAFYVLLLLSSCNSFFFFFFFLVLFLFVGCCCCFFGRPIVFVLKYDVSSTDFCKKNKNKHRYKLSYLPWINTISFDTHVASFPGLPLSCAYGTGGREEEKEEK